MRVTIRDSGDLRRLNKLLREQADGKELRTELSAGLRGAVRPIVPKVRAAYRAAPSRAARRRQGPPLRTLLARATRAEVRTSGRLAGARVRVDGRRMPPGMGSLPAMWEGPGRGKRWRHPVFGDRDTWVGQESRPTFYPIVDRHEADARRAVEEAVERVARRLERG